MDSIKVLPVTVKQTINNVFKEKEPWQIVTITASTVVVSFMFWNFLFQDESIKDRCRKKIFKLLRLVPSIKKKIDGEFKKIAENFENDTIKRINGQKYTQKLPENGLPADEILKQVAEHIKLGEYKWQNGYVSGAVYYFDDDLINLMKEVYGLASYTNPLHTDVFPGINKMEAEVVRMSANLFHGRNNSCGTMTTGGSESIMMACKAYRDFAREERGIRKPEIVMPVTAHTAFNKSGLYLGMRIRSISVSPVTFKVDLKAMEKAITKNTVMLVGSAPNFPYGTMDDIEEISKLGVKYNIPVHVDACLGGFLIVFAEMAGYDLPLFDFRLPGVTSISADTHKYGFSPKGSSVVLYSDYKYRYHQFTVTTDWPGGVYGSPTVSGSRAGGLIAACWATMLYFGLDGYVDATKSILKTTNYIETELRKIKEIYIFGKPATSVIALGSKIFEIYNLSDLLNKCGWNLNALQYPSGIHICITHVHTRPGVADKFLDDVRTAVIEIMKNPTLPVEGKMAIYGVAQNIPDRSIVGDFTRLYIDSMYYTPASIQNGDSTIPKE